jgi:DNA-binding NtrC family response regulator
MKTKSGARWMVVDDDADALGAIARLLGAISDAEICSYPSPWQALDAFIAAPDAFHFVVTAFEMPSMNGVDFRRHVHAVVPGAKVLLITGAGLFSEETALQSGFCGLLNKPFSLPMLKQALETINAPATNFSKIQL